MRLDRRMTPEAIEAALRQEAASGPARSVRLNERLGLLAGWLARIAAEPLALEDAAPDQSGIDLAAHGSVRDGPAGTAPSESNSGRGETEAGDAVGDGFKRALAGRPASALVQLTGTEIVAAVRARELAVADVVASFLERIERLEPALAAWAAVDADGARAMARELDAEAALGQFRPLHGLPFGVKDIIDVRGLPTAAGYQPFAGRRAAHDAAVVARLRELGAVPLGKTHTTQFAHGDPAPTFNPYNRLRTPGGSSAGSGAAVAARLVPLALGTQTAGSVLRPAAYNGAVGFKPSFNWFSREGVLPLAWSLDHLGLIVVVAADAALVYHALTDQAAGEPAPATPRIGLALEFLERAEPAVAAHLEQVAGRLESAGARVEPVRLPVELELLLAVHAVVMASEVAAAHAESLAAEPEHYGPVLQAEIEAGQLIPAAYDLKARRLRRRLAAAMDSFLAGFDALLLPTAANVAPTRATTGDRTFQAPWSLLGTPAISLPTGLGPDGLPIGSQLVARRGADGPLLAVAGWAELTLGLIVPPEVG